MRLWLLALAVMITVLAAGCSSSNPEANRTAHPQNQSNSESMGQAFPRTVKHIGGETVIESKPLKIVTPYIGFVDYLAVLDEYPIGAQGVEIIRANFPSLSKKLQGKEVADLGMEASLEKILALEPDLILAADDMTEQYDQLSQIAKTVIFPQAGDWRETLQQIAEAIGKEDKAKAVLAEFDRKSAEYKEQLVFRKGETVMFAMYSGKDQFTTWNDGRFDPFYNGLGLTPLPNMEGTGQLSLESLAELNPDHLFIINNWQTPIAGGVQEALKESSVWNSMQAVKAKQVYYLEDPSLPGPMALAKIDGIDYIMEALRKK
ncbi:ABC transporter substrate-binding protein [Paenibacillus sp. GCM10027626]|uniref:ABC transporter substrate-binding protein n=1 Tax=Paenibacillus sp. GCM10027626 TaxID=3273411 RepID=UPI0036280320